MNNFLKLYSFLLKIEKQKKNIKHYTHFSTKFNFTQRTEDYKVGKMFACCLHDNYIYHLAFCNSLQSSNALISDVFLPLTTPNLLRTTLNSDLT